MKSRSRSRKIGKVVSVAAAEERRYGQIAGQSQRYLDEQLQRLGELNAYRHNYVGSVGGGSAVNSAHWKDYQNFLSRLDAAVGAQQQIVHNCEQAALTHRQQWLAKRQRVESLQRVLSPETISAKISMEAFSFSGARASFLMTQSGTRPVFICLFRNWPIVAFLIIRTSAMTGTPKVLTFLRNFSNESKLNTGVVKK